MRRAFLLASCSLLLGTSVLPAQAGTGGIGFDPGISTTVTVNDPRTGRVFSGVCSLFADIAYANAAGSVSFHAYATVICYGVTPASMHVGARICHVNAGGTCTSTTYQVADTPGVGTATYDWPGTCTTCSGPNQDYAGEVHDVLDFGPATVVGTPAGCTKPTSTSISCPHRGPAVTP
jgi:hypothetical protein